MKHISRMTTMLVFVGVIAGCGQQPKPAPLAAQSVAPVFTLPTARGGSFTLEKGALVLLSFISTHAEVDAPTSDPSRSQLVFVQSMIKQYGDQGLHAVVIETATPKQPQRANNEDLLNFSYDWNLGAVLLADTSDAATARTYDVGTLPTTFLVNSDGVVVQRWDGAASAAQLALSIQALLGTSQQATPCAATAAQAPFVGLSLARPLSPQIWLVDGGGVWNHATERPVRWIVVAEDAATLQVTASAENGTAREFARVSLEPLPADQSNALLATLPHDNAAHAYAFAAPLHLATPGCVTLRAEVFRTGESIPVFRGEAIVAVE